MDRNILSYLLIALFALVFNSSYSQVYEHTKLISDESLISEYAKRIEKNHSKAKSNIDSKHAKDYKTYFKSRRDYQLSLSERNDLILKPFLQDYLQSLKDKIQEGNPNYDLSEVEFFFNRYYWGNAFAVDDGSIYINIGLFPLMETEDQLIFILCHELSHYILAHNSKRLDKQIAFANSKETKDQIKEIYKTEYYQNAKAKEFILENTFSQRAHSRDLEASADSMALLLMANTSYNTGDIITTLEMLDKYNDLFDSTKVDFEQLLYSKVEKEIESIGVRIENNDKIAYEPEAMLKTHPDCETRIETIHKLMELHGLSPKDRSTESKEFDKLKETFNFELLESYIHYYKYDRALIQAARMQASYTTSVYLKDIIGYSFARLIKEKSEYRIWQYTSAPKEYKDESYSELLKILHNNRLGNLIKACKKYADKNAFRENKSERALISEILSADLSNEKSLKEKLILEYQSLYEDGYYKEYVKYL